MMMMAMVNRTTSLLLLLQTSSSSDLSSSTLCSFTSFSPLSCGNNNPRPFLHLFPNLLHHTINRRHLPTAFISSSLKAASKDDSNNGIQSFEMSSSSSSEEADKLVDCIDFGELCNEFECISSPSVESTARQLVRDIFELRQGNRALGTFASTVKYKDPVRTFTGREKYKRSLWVTYALEKPSVTVQEMIMLSTSVLSIRWTVKGRPKSLLASVVGDLIVKVKSQFTLNQISGQVLEHEETWDLSASSAIAQLFFWTSRRLFAANEAGNDIIEALKDNTSRFSMEKKNLEIYPDPRDPTKFFQGDDGFQRDAYQIALLLAIIYFVVQYLKTTL